MFLSFIVPVYNTEKYIAECLDSLLDQDIPKDDYEIICINDGSTDGSSQILNKYRNIYSNIIVIDQLNSGVAIARNTGLDAARGEYIWFIDSDDMIKSNILAQLYVLITESHTDRMKIGTYIFDDQISLEEKNRLKTENLCVNSHFYDSSSVTSILRRDFLEEHQCRFRYPELTHGEDTVFMYEIIIHEPKCNELDIPIYFYRHHQGSVTTQTNEATLKRKLYSYFYAAQIMKKYYDDSTVSDNNTANLLMSYIWFVMYECTKSSRNERRSMIKKMKDQGLYPFIKPESCTHVRSYQTTRTDIIGKIFDKVYINMHRPWGYWGMYMIQKLIQLKRNLVK